LVLADTLVQHDVDTTAVGDPIGLVSTVNVTEFSAWEPETCLSLLRGQGVDAAKGRVATGDWFAVKGDRARWIVDTFHPLVVEMEACAVAQVCLRNGAKFAALKSVSDHLFADNQTAEYFDFGQAVQHLGKVVLPLAQALSELK
jgi:adenosylhomocysteine nucleosidase